MHKCVEIFDTTLRDGAQSEGVSFSQEDKLSIVRELDNLGVAYIEAGNPFSAPKEALFFEKIRELELKNSRIVAFGSTTRKNTAPAEDENVKRLLQAGTDVVAVFGKSHDFHVRDILRTTPEENRNMIFETCAYLIANGREVFFDAEHFFDGYKADRKYALETIRAAAQAGASRVILCDTNGAAFPGEIQSITQEVIEALPGVKIGIHAHNDRGLAVANSIFAVYAGAVQVQGTYLGFGERCGNANLATVIANLQTAQGIRCINQENLQLITPTARTIAEISNVSIRRNEPYVGDSAFAHKAGMHTDGVLKAPKSFEHIDPNLVGNERKLLLSDMAGRNLVLRKISKICPEIQKESPQLKEILSELKELERRGYQFEGAKASFELLVRRHTGKHNKFFNLIDYKIISDKNSGEDSFANAIVKIEVNSETQIMAAEGNGPVNALDKALRQALELFYPALSHMRLIDYKVRVVDPKRATAAGVRVLMSSSDGKDIWTTVGASADVIKASLRALVDSIEYKLTKDKENELKGRINDV